MVDMTEVNNSSIIAKHGYCPETRTLAIEFKGGSVHHYQDVGQRDYDRMCNASSIGSHVQTVIRKRFKSEAQ